ncbi:aspartate/glutamate racemase family protein [Pseudomaricurvus alkylphenolicus]|uniref:aspartate/glutamate racemase family protein n=1 Tax=Pseudomaricurvus alkylphenolicus TaxID=1306991 RepID=UPI00141E6CC0|nr:aspartate/glutamate racemase family protein [Pseudomaricurvus alkylphenolicus]NIB38046.1 aspartate/glutamate racemase family protein [Pseudomaricurvus alkylphenolicus]
MKVFKQKIHRPTAYGYCVGVMDFPWKVPYIPGDVTNASTYDYPVLIKTYTGVDLTRVVTGDRSEKDGVLEAVKDMNRQGVKGITGDCGFLLNYLDEATREVDIPLFMSSLQQLPVIASMIGQDKAIAVVTPGPEQMTQTLLDKTGFDGVREVIALGLLECEEFASKLCQESDCVDSDKVEAEIVALTSQAAADHPNIGAFLFECSMLPPYSKAVQEATGLPVFDFLTMIDLFQKATHRRRFEGYY